MSSEDDDRNRQQTFQKLKAICVPLMGATLLTPATVPNVSNRLLDLLQALGEMDLPVQLTPPLISYIFLPVSTILRRNPPSAIPDRLLEKIFMVMSLLCDTWWWTCETPIWEQIFMLCGAVIGNVESKGKGKDRDEETKLAAARCLLALLRDRTASDALQHSTSVDKGKARRAELVEHAQNPKFVPILGQTLNSILLIVESPFLDLQRLSLELTYLIVDIYASDHLVLSVLPGVVSTMTKVALGTASKKAWANGEAVASALKVMQSVVVRAIADNLCIRDGALSHAESLEALAEMVAAKKEEPPQQDLPAYATSRTSSWLRGTSSQIHIAINSLSSLLSHPTPAAHMALCRFSSAILQATPLSLPQTQPLLLSFLLFLSTSDLPSVSVEAQNYLRILFSGQTTSNALLQTLMQITKDRLQSLPRLISSSADSKVEHAAKVITAVALLSLTDDGSGVQQISLGIGKLLGLAGGIEKWGWGLLSVLELVEPMVTVSHPSASHLMLENDPDASEIPAFPAPRLRNLTSPSAVEALEKMFFALGRAAGESSLFSVEWFADLGLSGTRSNSVTALWCTCRLFEGVAMVSVTSDPKLAPSNKQTKTLERFARTLAKNIGEIWDETTVNGEDGEKKTKDDLQDDSLIPIEHIQGLRPISETLNITTSQPAKPPANQQQPTLHRSLCLQLLALTAGILQSQFPLLFIQTLYPILHSLTSTESFLSLTALATLKYITIVTSYASPANLLLSNFDYALDSVSRRLTRRWLDINATKVLVILVRLVGSDVVERAGDVVEECFDRLDDYNDYPVVVQGLIEVLSEVITVIRSDTPSGPDGNAKQEISSDERWGAQAFLRWYRQMKEEEAESANDHRAPRTAWGSTTDREGVQGGESASQTEMDAEQPATPIQALTKQIVSRSVYFLTHGSPIIRARILMLLTSAAAVLPESALLPSIHSAWSFILNRLSDNEPFVIAAAASLIEALTTHAGEFMFRRIWDDVWPRFQKLLDKLNAADSKSALARRGYGAIGTASAYTTSHRLYRSIIKTMTATIKGVQPHEASLWHVTLSFRRFLSQHAHEELQLCARDLYLAIASRNADVVWVALSATTVNLSPVVFFLLEDKWKVEPNVDIIFNQLEHQAHGYHE